MAGDAPSGPRYVKLTRSDRKTGEGLSSRCCFCVKLLQKMTIVWRGLFILSLLSSVVRSEAKVGYVVYDRASINSSTMEKTTTKLNLLKPN